MVKTDKQELIDKFIELDYTEYEKKNLPAIQEGGITRKKLKTYRDEHLQMMIYYKELKKENEELKKENFQEREEYWEYQEQELVKEIRELEDMVN